MIGRRFEIKQVPPATAAAHAETWAGAATLGVMYWAGVRDWKLIAVPFAVMVVVWLVMMIDPDD